MTSRREFYENRIKTMQEEISVLAKSSGQFSRMRIVAALAVFASFALPIALSYRFLIAVALTVVYILLLKRHRVIMAALTNKGILAELNRNELANIQHLDDFFDFTNNEEADTHAYANDLDLFGSWSLMRSLNRTITTKGKAVVVHNLLHPLNDIPAIENRKEAISDLTEKIDWRQTFWALGSVYKEKNASLTHLDQWKNQEAFFKRRQHWLWIAGTMFAAVAALIIYMIAAGKLLLPFVLIAFALNSVIQIFTRKPLNHYFRHFQDQYELLHKWANLSKHISHERFESTIAAELKSQIGSAGDELEKIARLSSMIDYRSSDLLQGVINALCPFDILFIYQIERWRMTYGSKIETWTSALAGMDALNSYANFKFNHPDFCNPEVVAGHNNIVASAMAHPLMPEELTVANDFEIGDSYKSCIITGSNMTGKSTFIRAIGLNTVLALNGLPVCASSFRCSPLLVMSCIRINDSLEENRSYFFSELRRLEYIIQQLATGAPHFILLDEILRGTNSEDKRIGTIEVYKKLTGFNCIAILATHDIELGKLSEEYPGRFKNFCFESNVVGNDITFDFKLRAGVSTTRNATLLMRQLNIID